MIARCRLAMRDVMPGRDREGARRGASAVRGRGKSGGPAVPVGTARHKSHMYTTYTSTVSGSLPLSSLRKPRE